MLELPHTLVGAAIATAIPNPIVALPLCLAVHFASDYIPHWNPHLHTEKHNGGITSKTYFIMGADSGAALLIGTYIALTRGVNLTHTAVILAACFLSVAPDILEIPYYLFDMHIPWVKKLIGWQRAHQWNVKPVWGILAQLGVVIAALAVIYR